MPKLFEDSNLFPAFLSKVVRQSLEHFRSFSEKYPNIAEDARCTIPVRDPVGCSAEVSISSVLYYTSAIGSQKVSTVFIYVNEATATVTVESAKRSCMATQQR